MSWMLTATGAEINIRYINPDEITALAIGHQLAQINRYTGAASRPYSVAEHSLLVVEILEREQRETAPEVLLAALLHDAHEFITGDLSSPMKEVIGYAWKMEEDRIARQVRERFGVGWVFSTPAGDLIKWADLTALSTERVALMPAGQTRWPVVDSHLPVDWANFDASATWTWQDWREAWLDRFGELHYAVTNGATA